MQWAVVFIPQFLIFLFSSLFEKLCGRSPQSKVKRRRAMLGLCDRFPCLRWKLILFSCNDTRSWFTTWWQIPTVYNRRSLWWTKVVVLDLPVILQVINLIWQKSLVTNRTVDTALDSFKVCTWYLVATNKHLSNNRRPLLCMHWGVITWCYIVVCSSFKTFLNRDYVL